MHINRVMYIFQVRLESHHRHGGDHEMLGCECKQKCPYMLEVYTENTLGNMKHLKPVCVMWILFQAL